MALPRATSEAGCSSSSNWLAAVDNTDRAAPTATASAPLPQVALKAAGVASGDQPKKLGACSAICASPAVAAELQGLLQQQLSAETSLLPPEQKQQWQQVLQQLAQQQLVLPALPALPSAQDMRPLAQQPPPQQQQKPTKQRQLDDQHPPVYPANSAGVWCMSTSPSGSSQSSHSSVGAAGNSGSLCSFPSTGQPLTPNQKLQLQRYLMRQQHLLQTSGMRVRPPPPAAVLPNGAPMNANGRGQQTDSSSGSDVGGCSGSGNGRTVRRTQEQHRSRTYIVQGTYAGSAVGCIAALQACCLNGFAGVLTKAASLAYSAPPPCPGAGRLLLYIPTLYLAVTL